MAHWALPEIDLALCNRCGSCIDECPTEAVEMGPEGPFISQPEECTFCADCEAICSQGAISCSFEIVWEPRDRVETPEDRGNDRA